MPYHILHYYKYELERALGKAHTFAAATFLVPFHDLDPDPIDPTI